MRLIIKFNEYGDVQTWYRELDGAELPAKMALFTPWVPYITVYIFAQFRPYLLSFALSDIIGKGV